MKNVQISDRMRDKPHEIRRRNFILMVIAAFDITQNMVRPKQNQLYTAVENAATTPQTTLHGKQDEAQRDSSNQ
jgi:hypothetical protein